MGIVRSVLLSALLAVAAHPLRADAPLVDLFAGCAGRLSAQMEHQWLMGDPGSDRTQARQRAMVALLDTVTPPDLSTRAMALRVEAKQAQATLLRRASFGGNTSEASWARRRASKELAACTGLLLG